MGHAQQIRETLGRPTRDDFRVCASLHRRYGSSYFLSSRLLSQPYRDRTDALYAFVRVPDEWVDNPGRLQMRAAKSNLAAYRRAATTGDLQDGLDETAHAVLRAFLEVKRDCGLSDEDIVAFLDAMAQDFVQNRFETFEELNRYMRGSAVAVGLMMLAVLDVELTPETESGAMALGMAMQLTNFIRDVREDAGRGRIYLPLVDLRRFGVTEDDVFEAVSSSNMRELISFEIHRSRELYAAADAAIRNLPRRARKAVRLARELYAAILDEIERADGDVFSRRARVPKWRRILIATRVLVFG